MKSRKSIINTKIKTIESWVSIFEQKVALLQKRTNIIKVLLKQIKEL